MPLFALPPGPVSRFPGQHLFAFRRDPIRFLQRMAREYGDVVTIRIGPENVYLVNEPDLIRDILVTQSGNFHKSRGLERAKRLLGAGLLTSEDDFHRRQRRLVQPAFHRQRIAGYAGVMAECAENVQQGWLPGQTVDMAEEMMRLTLAIVGKTLFNTDVEASATQIREALNEVIGLFHLLMLPYADLLERLPLPPVRRFHRARAQLDAIIYRLIQEHRSAAADQGDLLSMLLEAQNDESGQMSDIQIRDEALTLLLAGHETTANALAWTWYLLSQHPEAETKFHVEIDGVLGRNRLPTIEDMAVLPYTRQVLAESMRLYPPAWVIGRRATTTYAIRDYRLPPGSIILMSPSVTHRDPRWYADPDRFAPERWTLENEALRPKFSYFPFGGGPRTCIGEQFAWMEGVLLLATLGQRWQMRLAPGHRVAWQPIITLRPRGGMPMILERRAT